MTKAQDIDDILAARPIELLIEALWDDPATQAKIRNSLIEVSIYNISHYHKHFCGGKYESKE